MGELQEHTLTQILNKFTRENLVSHGKEKRKEEEEMSAICFSSIQIHTHSLTISCSRFSLNANHELQTHKIDFELTVKSPTYINLKIRA